MLQPRIANFGRDPSISGHIWLNSGKPRPNPAKFWMFAEVGDSAAISAGTGQSLERAWPGFAWASFRIRHARSR